MIDKHCETCYCTDPSKYNHLNLRVRRLIREGLVVLSDPLPPAVGARLVDAPTYRFGFRDFMPSQENQRLVAVFLCALKDPYEYFGVCVPRPGDEPKPFKYNKGDCFFVGDVRFCYEDLEAVAGMSDGDVANWLNGTLESLREFVISQVGDGLW